MIPRKKLDIGWFDLAWAVGRTLLPDRRQEEERRLEEAWDPAGQAVPALSVRSAFDLLLSELALPRGTEILMSAITIGDMATIARSHGLVVVPVELELDTLCVTPEALARAWSPRVRICVVAHLFGSRMELGPVAAWSRRRGILLVEDAAQAFAGDDYRGHPEADVALFSFGPIKTTTALGGAMASFRDPGLAASVRARGQALPPQPPHRFRARVLRFLAIQLLLLPPIYTLMVALVSRVLSRDHDAWVNASARGFPGGGLLAGIRHRPCGALLALVRRRLHSDTRERVEARVRAAREVLALVPHLPRPGEYAPLHTHWVVPVAVEDPEAAGARLRASGVDATRGASSLRALPPCPGDPTRAAPRAEALMGSLLYLPCHAGMPPLPLPPLQALCPPSSLSMAQRHEAGAGGGA